MTRRRFLMCMAAIPVSVALARTAEGRGIVRMIRLTTRLAIDDTVPQGSLSLCLALPTVAGAFDVHWTGRGIRSTLSCDASGPLLKLAWGDGPDRTVEIVQTTTGSDRPVRPVADPGFNWDYSSIELA